MTTPSSRPERHTAGQERFTAAAAEPVVTTTAERYVMSGGRTPRLAIKEGDLFLYSDALGQAPGSERRRTISTNRQAEAACRKMLVRW